MKRSFLTKLGTFAAAITVLGMAATSAFAQSATGSTATTPRQPAPKHDSNTFHKIGKAIQYTTRKDVTNLSVDTHKTTHSKSVVRNRATGNNYVEKPNGHTVFKSTTNPYVYHRHHRHRHHHHMVKK